MAFLPAACKCCCLLNHKVNFKEENFDILFGKFRKFLGLTWLDQTFCDSTGPVQVLYHVVHKTILTHIISINEWELDQKGYLQVFILLFLLRIGLFIFILCNFWNILVNRLAYWFFMLWLKNIFQILGIFGISSTLSPGKSNRFWVVTIIKRSIDFRFCPINY